MAEMESQNAVGGRSAARDTNRKVPFPSVNTEEGRKNG